MARGRRWVEGDAIPGATTDEGNAQAEVQHVRNYVWNTVSLAWDRMTQPSGGTGGGGGGAVTVSDGADVAQGTTTDASSANTVIGLLKALKAALTGTLTTSVSNFPGSQAVTGPLTDTQLRATAVPVSGTFFQGTQPVSIATNTPDVTDRAARLLGHVTVDSAPTTPVTGPLTDTQLRASAVPVSGTFFQATQPVSLATNTPDVTDRAARLLGHVTVDNAAEAAANLCVTNTAATGVACTLTIPAAGAGLFHYISLIEIQLYATAARTGGATPILVTTTNLPGSPVWDFDTAQAIGVTIRQATAPAAPIKSSAANTATTIVAPIATTGIWRITAYYTAAV